MEKNMINKHNVAEYVARFNRCETTIAEEKALCEFFSHERDVPSALRKLIPLFLWYRDGAQGRPEEYRARYLRKRMRIVWVRRMSFGVACAWAVVFAILWLPGRFQSVVSSGKDAGATAEVRPMRNLNRSYIPGQDRKVVSTKKLFIHKPIQAYQANGRPQVIQSSLAGMVAQAATSSDTRSSGTSSLRGVAGNQASSHDSLNADMHYLACVLADANDAFSEMQEQNSSDVRAAGKNMDVKTCLQENYMTESVVQQ